MKERIGGAIELRNLDVISGIVLFLFGLGIFLKSLRYPLGSLRAPGAGLFPLIASTILMIVSGFIVGHSALKKNVEEAKSPFFQGKEAPKRILLGFSLLLMFRYLFPIIGFAPSAFCFISFLSKFLGHYNWKVSLLISTCSSLGSYFLFQVFLKIQMPLGIFGI
jgi:hypothetical protein